MVETALELCIAVLMSTLLIAMLLSSNGRNPVFHTVQCEFESRQQRQIKSLSSRWLRISASHAEDQGSNPCRDTKFITIENRSKVASIYSLLNSRTT